MKHSFVFAALAALTTNTAGQTVEFFYTDTINLCSLNDASIPATDQTTHGGICAYRPDTERVYACPAPDPTCWTYYETCASGGSNSQITCNRLGAVWCCAADETCTTTAGQVNVCISNFTSPNSGVSVDQANQKYLAALGVSNVTATSQTVDPTPFSTRVLSSSTSSTRSSSTTSSASSSGTSSSAQTSSTSLASTASTTSSGSPSTSSSSAAAAATSSSSSKSGISGGAIGGIVVGVIALLALVGVIFFFLGRRNKNKKQDPKQSLANEIDAAAPSYSSQANPIGELHGEKKSGYHGGQTYSSHTSELGSEGNGRVEMSGSEWRPAAPRYEMA